MKRQKRKTLDEKKRERQAKGLPGKPISKHAQRRLDRLAKKDESDE